MEWKVRIDEKKMIEVLRLFSKAIGVPVLFYSYEPKKWISDSKRNRPFCHTLERNPTTNELCCMCDEDTHQRCLKVKVPFSYYCHAGLLEVICPVYYEENYIGYLVIGQFRTRRKKSNQEYLKKLAAMCGVEVDTLLKKYKSHAVLSKEAVEGLQLLEHLCSEYLLKIGVFRLEHHEIVAKVEKYIRNNVERSLTLEELASHVFVTPAYLSYLYREVTGEKLSSYIQNERVEAAEKLIRTTRMSFSDIASKTGFGDGNYFTKVFRKVKNMTPSEYRKRWKSGEAVEREEELEKEDENSEKSLDFPRKS